MGEVVTNFSDICTACGLCCDGTLFAYATVQPDEIGPLRKLGIPVEEFEGQTGFGQPCGQLCGTRCGIYEARPKVCRDYNCVMLNRIARGEIGSDQASQRVAQVRAAVADLAAELLPGETINAARKRLHADGANASPRFKIRLGVVELMLDRYFRTAAQKAFGRMAA